MQRLEPRHTLFTYLHLAPDPELTRGLVESGATCVAYETVEDARGRLPLLAPMSEVAGKIATQAGAFMLEKPLGGRGLLLGGVPGVAAGKVLVWEDPKRIDKVGHLIFPDGQNRQNQ